MASNAYEWILQSKDTAEIAIENFRIVVSLSGSQEYNPSRFDLPANASIHERLNGYNNVFNFDRSINANLIEEVIAPRWKVLLQASDTMRDFFSKHPDIFESLRELEGFEITEEAIGFLTGQAAANQLPYVVDTTESSVKTTPRPAL